MTPKASNKIARLTIGAAIATILLLAGCTAPAPTSNPSTNAKEIILKDVAFSPKELTIPAGTTVKWVNKEEMPHDVTGKEKAWQSTGGMGAMKMGMSYSKTFTEPGTYEYYCTLHSSGPGNGMSGKIIVQ